MEIDIQVNLKFWKVEKEVSNKLNHNYVWTKWTLYFCYKLWPTVCEYLRSDFPPISFSFNGTVLESSDTKIHRNRSRFIVQLFYSWEGSFASNFVITNGAIGNSTSNTDLVIHVSGWKIIEQMEANCLHCISIDSGRLRSVWIRIASNIHFEIHLNQFRRMSIYTCGLHCIHQHNLCDDKFIFQSTFNTVYFWRINIDSWS